MKKYWRVFVFILFAIFCLPFVMAESADETAKGLDMTKALQGGQKVFLCFYDPTDPGLDVVKGVLETVGSNFRGTLEIVYVSIADKNEKKLTEKFIIQSGYVTVFVIAPPRNIIAELRGGDITKENLMKALFPSRKPGGGCCPGETKPCGCSGHA